ncbi:MAG: HD domain-containing protein [Blautia sp.]|nr:HD domain-containing protein [Blautia sp.]
MVNKEERKLTPWVTFILLCAGCLLINFLGVRLALRFSLPLYLDGIGIVLASVLGGYIPGIMVGFLSNLINGISDYTTMYYGVISVLIALAVAWFAQRGWLKKIRTILLGILVMALIGGGIGSVLTWALYGFDFATGISAPLALWIYRTVHLSKFWSQFSADMLIDIADKGVTLLTAICVMRLMPAGLRRRLRFYGWKQTPLSEETIQKSRFDRAGRLSLGTKVLIVIALASLLIAFVVTWISYLLFHNSTIETQSRLAYGVTNVVASNFEAEMVDEYLEKGEEAEGYRQTKARLAAIIRSTPDIEFVYVYRIEEDGCHVVFDPDTAEVEGLPPGTVVPFDEAFEEQLPDLLAGKEIEPVISDETYGWLLSVYRPVYDENGVCQCYACADISMDRLRSTEQIFLTRVIAMFLGFFAIILAVGLWLVKYSILMPINSMAYASSRLAYDTEKAREETIGFLKELKISTGDEIENLYYAMIKNAEDTASHIVQVEEKNNTISRMQDGLIMVLADLVESRDQCTGNHIRNTALYVQIIMEELKKKGIYKEQMTDEFISDVIHSAPLHDVGKISVADAILNKPGKLTPEEFEQMKGHAAAGGEIITRAIELISEEGSTYLEEARNLAEFHHEKWNGTGYPTGLSGTQIPLSARIMAVADVFDALVSKRSYKDGFPVEKALDIIREGSGSHFDPYVAEAFLKAEDQVRKVVEGGE